MSPDVWLHQAVNLLSSLDPGEYARFCQYSKEYRVILGLGHRANYTYLDEEKQVKFITERICTSLWCLYNSRLNKNRSRLLKCNMWIVICVLSHCFTNVHLEKWYILRSHLLFNNSYSVAKWSDVILPNRQSYRSSSAFSDPSPALAWKAWMPPRLAGTGAAPQTPLASASLCSLPDSVMRTLSFAFLKWKIHWLFL